MVRNPRVSVVVVTRNRKDEALKCLKSIYNQIYKPFEVVLVNNASEDNTSEIIKEKYPDLILIESKINTGGAGGRNLGLKKTSGDYVLFMDDDAEAGRNMVKELLSVIQNNRKIGIVQPKIYLKDRRKVIQGVGHGVNLLTGRVYGIGVGETDTGQYDRNIEIPMAGCTWMVRREVFEKVGDYDEDYFIPYEDSDFSYRTREAGFIIMFSYKARVWHQGPKNTSVPESLQWIGITTPERAYRVARNKMIFMKKHASITNLFFFIIFFVPIYAFVHSIIIISTGKVNFLLDYWKGILAGYVYVLVK